MRFSFTALLFVVSSLVAAASLEERAAGTLVLVVTAGRVDTRGVQYLRRSSSGENTESQPSILSEGRQV